MQRSPAIGMPMLWVYAAVPTGAALMIVEIIVLLIATARKLWGSADTANP